MYAKNAHAQNRKNPKSWTPISMWWDHCDVPLAGAPMSRRLVALGLPKKNGKRCVRRERCMGPPRFHCAKPMKRRPRVSNPRPPLSVLSARGFDPRTCGSLSFNETVSVNAKSNNIKLSSVRSIAVAPSHRTKTAPPTRAPRRSIDAGIAPAGETSRARRQIRARVVHHVCAPILLEHLLPRRRVRRRRSKNSPGRSHHRSPRTFCANFDDPRSLDPGNAPNVVTRGISPPPRMYAYSTYGGSLTPPTYLFPPGMQLSTVIL